MGSVCLLLLFFFDIMMKTTLSTTEVRNVKIFCVSLGI